jgi:hypothetical protein
MSTNPIYQEDVKLPEATYCENCGKFCPEDGETVWNPPYWFKESYDVTNKNCENNCEQ